MKLDLDELGNILSAAWLQVDDELQSGKLGQDSKALRIRVFKLVENQMVKQGLAECRDARCQADHEEAIDTKYL